MNLSTEKFLCRLLLWLYGPAYVAAACYASYDATFVRSLFGAGSPQVLFSSVYRQFTLLAESFSMVAVLALMVAGLFLCSQYVLILRNREPVHSRYALWFVTSAQHLGFSIWFGYAMALYQNDTSPFVQIASIAASVGFPLLIATLSALQAQFYRVHGTTRDIVSLSQRPKEIPYLTVVTFKFIGLGLLISYLNPIGTGWEAFGDALLRVLWLSGIVLPFSILSLLRRETGAPALIPVLAIAYCLWGLIAGGTGLATLFEG